MRNQHADKIWRLRQKYESLLARLNKIQIEEDNSHARDFYTRAMNAWWSLGNLFHNISRHYSDTAILEELRKKVPEGETDDESDESTAERAIHPNAAKSRSAVMRTLTTTDQHNAPQIATAASNLSTKKRKSRQIVTDTTTEFPAKRISIKKDPSNKTSTLEGQISTSMTTVSPFSTYSGLPTVRHGMAREDLPVSTEDSVFALEALEAHERQRLNLAEECRRLRLEKEEFLEQHASKLPESKYLAVGHEIPEVNWVQAMNDFTAAHANLTKILECEDHVMKEIVHNVVSCTELRKYKVSGPTPRA